MTIPKDHISFNDDGTAWLVVAADPAEYGWAVALDRPCDHCMAMLRWDPITDEAWKCPDCIDGRHTFTIEVQCPCTLGRSGSMPDCGGTGKLTYRVSVIPGMVLPIVDKGQQMVAAYDKGCILMTEHRETHEPMTLFVKVGADLEHVTLPPAATPGMWAVKLRTATTLEAP